MNNDDIDECLRKKWIEAFKCNDKLNELLKSLENNYDIANRLKYQGKFYFVMGDYEKALADLTEFLELKPKDTFALRYRGETYYIMEKYEESLADLNKLLKINTNNKWLLKIYELLTNNKWLLKIHEEVTRK